MKKFTLMIASMLLCMGAWAQSEATRMTADALNAVTEKLAIAIECTQIESYNSYYNGSGRTPETGTDIIFYWVPVEDGVAGAYYIMRGDGENDYLQSNNITTFGTKDNAAKFHAVKPYNGGAGVESFGGADCFYNETDEERACWVRLAFLGNSKWFNFNGMQYNGGTGVWTVQFVHSIGEPVSITYNFKYNDEIRYTQTAEVIIGNAFPDFELPYGIEPEKDKPGGTVEAADTYEFAVAVDELPFTYASDYASIENWYYINIHTDGYYLNYKEGAESMDLTATAVPTDQKDAYTWAFIGNPFDGYQIVNKAAGESMILSSSTTMAGTNGSGTYPIMTNTPVADGHNTLWFATASTYRTNGFYLEQFGVSANKMNKRDSKLAYWTKGKDAGSTFVVELRDDAADLQALVDAAEATLAAWEQTGVGYVTASAEDKTAVSDAVAAAKTAIENKTGYVAAQVALEEAVAAAKTSTIQPEAGKFYTIQNTYSNVYMNVNNGGTMAVSNEASISEVFLFVSAGEGKFYLKNVERGTFLNNAPVHGGGHVLASAATEGAAKAVTIANLGVENRVSITPEGGATIHHDAGQGVIIGWNGAAGSRSAWKIVEVDVATHTHAVAVTEAGWATLTLGYNATIPAGVTAYAVSEIDGQYAKLAEVTGVIPAGEAVLLNAEAGTYEFKYAESAEPVASNLLEGTVFNTNVTADAYVLAAKENVVGLYKATKNQAENTAFLNNAFKAYLPVAGASAPMFSLERGEGTTGIETAVSGEQTVVIYDLAGRRVEKMEKGIYIVNGKKVVR